MLVEGLVIAQVLIGSPRVIDGDTLIMQGERVRLACIDAPEMQQERGLVARNVLYQFLQGNPIRITIIGTDRFQRKLGIVEKGNRNINVEMVAAGQAFVYRQYLDACPVPIRTALLAAEGRAKQLRIGVWQDNPPQYPWQQRRQ